MKLINILHEEKQMLYDYLQEYLKELSNYISLDKEGSIFSYPYFDSYFNNEDDHNAYFITIQNNIAGFVLVNDYNYDLYQYPNVNAIAEFYIFPDYRRQGIGELAAKEAIDQKDGIWLIQVAFGNLGAMKFWANFIQLYYPKATSISRNDEIIYVINKEIA